MNGTQLNPVYETSDEKELIKMWEDIKGTNTASLNRSLMKVIAQNEEKEDAQAVVDVTPLYSKEMWDSEKGEWVPFDMWGAHFIINERKECVQLRMLQPAPIQPEYGPVVMGWKSIDSSYLNDQLKENKSLELKIPETATHRGHRLFYGAFAQEVIDSKYEIIKDDRQQYIYEGRYQEFLGQTHPMQDASKEGRAI